MFLLQYPKCMFLKIVFQSRHRQKYCWYVSLPLHDFYSLYTLLLICLNLYLCIFFSTLSISLLITLKLLTSFNCLSIFKCAHFKSVCLCVLYVNECGVHLCLNNVLFVFYVVRPPEGWVFVLSLCRPAETVS